MLTYNQALQTILETIKVLPAQPVALADTLGRVLAAEVVATDDIPPFTNSAMDGFAVRAIDIAGAKPETPVKLKVIAEGPAGSPSTVEVSVGTAVRIMTGAPMPVGADTVVPLESTLSVSKRVVEVFKATRKGTNIRLAGEDARSGERVLSPGAVLRAAEIGLAAAVGATTLQVVPPARVAILTTGSELVDAGTQPGPGQIRDANLHALAAQVRACGALPVLVPRLSDRQDAVEEALIHTIEEADFIVTTGGVSVGDFDYVKSALEGLGAEKYFWRVKQKPGRPFAFWLLDKKPVFGNPGNPVSAMLCFEEYVRPALRKAMGFSTLHRPEKLAVLTDGYSKGSADGRLHFVRVVAREIDGQLTASSAGPQGSGILSSLARANAFALIPEDVVRVAKGEKVMLHMTDLPENR
jgi:molybdopterin molybdotransferase